MRLDLDGLGAASRKALMSEWREVVGRPPTKHLSRPLMVHILSHTYQLETVGAYTQRQPHARARRHGAGLAQQQRRRLTFVHAQHEMSVISKRTLRHFKETSVKALQTRGSHTLVQSRARVPEQAPNKRFYGDQYGDEKCIKCLTC